MANPDQDSFVALLDVLGFREHVSTLPLRELAAKVGRIVPRAERVGVERIQFSDSVLLYTEGTDDPTLFLRVVAEAADMIGENARRGILMRGAVTSGSFYRPSEQVFVGKAVVRAYELEQAQDWAGGIVDPDLLKQPALAQALADLRNTSYLIDYDAPIKGGTVGSLACLGWPWAYGQESLPELETKTWDARRKVNNAKKFLDKWNAIHGAGWST